MSRSRDRSDAYACEASWVDEDVSAGDAGLSLARVWWEALMEDDGMCISRHFVGSVPQESVDRALAARR